MLHDFSFHTPNELLAGLTNSNGNQIVMPNSGMGHNMNMGSGEWIIVDVPARFTRSWAP